MLKLVHPTWTKLKGNHTASLHVNSNNHMDGNNNKKNFFFSIGHIVMHVYRASGQTDLSSYFTFKDVRRFTSIPHDYKLAGSCLYRLLTMRPLKY
jgi:hypothetical protein